MLVIVAALNDELKLIRAEMEMDSTIHYKSLTASRGKFQNNELILLRSGIGQKRTHFAVEYAINNLNPSLMMNIGYCGGLDPRPANKDIIIADSVVDDASEAILKIDNSLIEKAVSACKSAEINYHKGRIVTVNQPLETPHDKAFIGTKLEAIACDMESFAFSKTLSETKIPYVVARSVLDSLDVNLPQITSSAVESGDVKITELLKDLKDNPKNIFKLPKFAFLATEAKKSLAAFIKAWIKNDFKEK